MRHDDRYARYTDEQLVDAINQGEIRAFDALYERYRTWTVRLAFRFTRDRDGALDVLQEVFAYVTGKFPGFELRARMTTFLYPVVKNVALRWRDKQGRMDLHDPSDLEALSGHAVPPHLSPSESDDPLMRKALVEVLGEISEAHREVVLMRFVDDMSLREIAEALAIPTGTVKSRLHLALKALRAHARTRALLDSES